MHLNNHGWGMRDMIIYTCVLILFLLLAAYLIMALYDNISIEEKPSNNSPKVETPVEEEQKPSEIIIVDYEYYKDKETSLKLATYNYLNDIKPEMTENSIKIELNTLVEKQYIEKIFDASGAKTCEAYSKAYLNEYGEYIVSPYIKCENYTTEGY